MNKQKTILLLVLSLFIIGMALAPASASHTFKKGGYKLTVSDSDYKKIKQGKKFIDKKVGTKTVKTWKTVKVKTYESWINSKGIVYKSKSWNPYNKVGYNAKYIKSVWRYYSDGDICWEYYKVPKIVKKNVYFHVFGIYDFSKDRFTGKIGTHVDTSRYCVC